MNAFSYQQSAISSQLSAVSFQQNIEEIVGCRESWGPDLNY
ncbi:MAG: hypothetical protein U9P37_09115 [Pseudomonadota bacterium]|nr:hypothetical protein [Pseudomonadota bacterium]